MNSASELGPGGDAERALDSARFHRDDPLNATASDLMQICEGLIAAHAELERARAESERLTLWLEWIERAERNAQDPETIEFTRQIGEAAGIKNLRLGGIALNTFDRIRAGDAGPARRCPRCAHELGPLACPISARIEGGREVWRCPCVCHSATAAT